MSEAMTRFALASQSANVGLSCGKCAEGLRRKDSRTCGIGSSKVEPGSKNTTAREHNIELNYLRFDIRSMGSLY